MKAKGTGNNWYRIGIIFVGAMMALSYATQFAEQDSVQQYLAYFIGIISVILYFFLRNRYIDRNRIGVSKLQNRKSY